MLPVSRVTSRIDSNVVLRALCKVPPMGPRLNPAIAVAVSALVAGTAAGRSYARLGAMLQANVGNGREQVRFGRDTQVNQSGSLYDRLGKSVAPDEDLCASCGPLLVRPYPLFTVTTVVHFSITHQTARSNPKLAALPYCPRHRYLLGAHRQFLAPHWTRSIRFKLSEHAAPKGVASVAPSGK